MIVFICFIVAMMAVFALRLYKLQTAELVTADADSMTYRTTMEASRGNILGRYRGLPRHGGCRLHDVPIDG